MHLRKSQPVTGALLDLVRHMLLDSARDVRSYIPALLECGQDHLQGMMLSGHHGTYPVSSSVSRPPPLWSASSEQAEARLSLSAMRVSAPDVESVSGHSASSGVVRDSEVSVGMSIRPETESVQLDLSGERVRVPV